MSVGKAQVQDGLNSNLQKFFWEDIKELLINAIKECIDNNDLMWTIKQGIITLLPKPGKDKIFKDNLRSITLLNVDYKLLTLMMANQLKVGEKKIDTQQHKAGS